MRQIKEEYAPLAKVVEMKTDMCIRIEKYLEDLSKRSEGTYTAYKTDINQFIESTFGKNMSHVVKSDFEKLDGDMLYDYFHQLYKMKSKNSGERVYKNTTINRKISAVSSLVTYLKASKMIESDIEYLTLIKALPDDTEEIEHMPLEVAKIYINAALRELHKSKEKQALIMLAVDSGLRLNELLSLTDKSFIEESDQIIINGKGKGNKEFQVAISRELYQCVMDNLGNVSGKLFTLSRKNIIDMMNRMKKELGYEDYNYTFHSFRKTALTITYEVAGLLEAQKKGHHKNLDTTKRYIKNKDLMMTGALSTGENIPQDMYKTVDQDILIEALEELSKDTQFILNLKINSILKSKEKK